jgi:5'-nucleotidase
LRILLANDDGVTSQGIQIISRMLAEKGWLAVVVAPDRERSGSGHAVTVDRPVRVHPLDPGMFSPGIAAYSCDGTPSDCVTIGLGVLCPTADCVVSGINQGPNLADDVTLSGTVCAAMEGTMMGRPAIAVSLCCKSGDSFKHNMTAALAAMAVVEYIEKNPLPKSVTLNVNVPNELIKNIKGFKITQRGNRKYVDRITNMKDPYGNDTYWIAGRSVEEHEEGTDITAVKDGYVSVTPLQLDMTQYDILVEMRSRDVDKKFAKTLNMAL